MFRWFKKKPQEVPPEVHIVVRVEVSGTISVNLENTEGLPSKEEYKSTGSSPFPSSSVGEGRNSTDAATPTISADFFADTEAPEVNFGEEVDTGDGVKNE